MCNARWASNGESWSQYICCVRNTTLRRCSTDEIKVFLQIPVFNSSCYFCFLFLSLPALVLSTTFSSLCCDLTFCIFFIMGQLVKADNKSFYMFFYLFLILLLFVQLVLYSCLCQYIWHCNANDLFYFSCLFKEIVLT